MFCIIIYSLAAVWLQLLTTELSSEAKMIVDIILISSPLASVQLPDIGRRNPELCAELKC